MVGMLPFEQSGRMVAREEVVTASEGMGAIEPTLNIRFPFSSISIQLYAHLLSITSHN